MKKVLKYVIVSAAVLALQAVLIRLGYVGFGFGTAIAVAYSLTLNLTKKTLISAAFTAAALLLDCLTMPYQHIGLYGIIAGSVALSFILVWLLTKAEFGLLLSDAMGTLGGYVPVYLCIKYLGESFIEADKYEYLAFISHYPLMIGCIAGGVMAFFAVPAVRVLERYAKEREEQN